MPISASGHEGQLYRVRAATAPELPQTRSVLDPFHVVRQAGPNLVRCRRRVQREPHAH
ncbi:hypothetical protein EII11_05410 [Schaalia canis]|uniref:Transposase IS204/IS1001/IS1096/IS1165 DDE domain-containing protein n=1 Tax=Schaalia canis TaxID=100469 RepID=A0A3P1SFF7_9ACTO|nr:hypothetical protein EII11_05410 [Schaalia canis]